MDADFYLADVKAFKPCDMQMYSDAFTSFFTRHRDLFSISD
jgi:hypothetical protein